MKKILQIARREFVATVMTKAFLIGILAAPVMMGGVILLMPLLIQNASPKVAGEIAVLDRSGALFDRLREQLAPEAFVERRRAAEARIQAVMPGAVRELAGAPRAQAVLDQGLDQALGQVPQLRVVPVDAGADLEAEKQALRGGERLALVVIHANAVTPDATQALDGGYGSYDLYVRPKLDDRVLGELRDAIRSSVVDARFVAQSLDAARIRALTRVPSVGAVEVGESGERRSNEVAARLLPIAFMALIVVAVMAAGQQLMTSTIEEKSSRVVELLLAAVSPTELMAGKILGQLAVAMLMFGLYGGVGLAALASFAALGMIDPWMLLYLPIFFLIAFVMIAALMAAIGAAVNELREAQTLLMPVVLALMLPMMLWLPISRDPNGTFATVLSFVPPTSPLVMVLRMTSSAPPPTWQVWLSIAIGIAAMFAAVWFAGRVFRVGLLMHGKPPDFRTLVRWARQA